jgi:hypothetical protein
VATGVINDSLAGRPQNPRHTQSQFVFTHGGWLATGDLKRIEAKLQRMVQVMRPLQMAPVEDQRSTPLNHFSEDCQLTERRNIPASWNPNYLFEAARSDSLRGALFCKALTR